MKTLPLVLVLLAVPVAAQETYSLPASATQASELAVVITKRTNNPLCDRYALSRPCTQTQVCAAAVAAGTVVPGGSSCTAAQARNAGLRIFPATQAGREEFVTFQIALPVFNAMKATIVSSTHQEQCQNWQAFTQPQKDAACTNSGLSAGCLLCN